MGRPPKFTRDRLLEVARAAFTQNGFEATTLDDIARELEVTPAAVLRHVESKKHLFFEAMTARNEEIALVLRTIDAIPATIDPHVVLRQFAERFVPFLEQKLQENLVLVLHANARSPSGDLLSSIPSGADSPPARVIAALERYFRRLRRAGALRLTSPRAAAILFLGSLHSYVFFHHLLKVSDPPFPLQRYIDQLLDLWSDGAVTAGRRRGGKRVR